jgi:ABC-type glycerol-3-phosphate transport system substrate-binding protein
MTTSRLLLLVGLLLALAACGNPEPAQKQATGWSKQLPYHTALLTRALAEACTEVDAYTGACVAR